MRCKLCLLAYMLCNCDVRAGWRHGKWAGAHSGFLWIGCSEAVHTVGMVTLLLATVQDMNPIPFVLILANCVAWVSYAVVTHDPFVFLANDPGVILGLFLSFQRLRPLRCRGEDTVRQHA